MVHPANNYVFSVTVCVHSKARFRKHSCSTLSKRNAVCGRRQPRPKGAKERSHSGVAALEKGKTILCALRLAVKPLFGSEPVIISWMDH